MKAIKCYITDIHYICHSFNENRFELEFRFLICFKRFIERFICLSSLLLYIECQAFKQNNDFTHVLSQLKISTKKVIRECF